MDLSHIDKDGQLNMVDVGNKETTSRTATAQGSILFPGDMAKELQENPITKKGSIYEVARIAAIMACKNTSSTIPLCHPLMITSVKVEFHWDKSNLNVRCTVKCSGQTGVEMEALHGVSVALLTVYDMTKAASKEMEIHSITLLEKSGGKSGHWTKDT